MKLDIISYDVVFDTVDTTNVYVSIVNNNIKLSTDNTIPFSGGVVNYLRDKFDEDNFECDFDNNTNCVIYIKPLKEQLAATMRKIVNSTIVEFGFISVFYDVVDDNEEEED